MPDRNKLFSPILILLLLNIVFGVFSLKSMGISWDEPYFYDYANAIRDAYTPQAFALGFDFNSLYGKSAEDHKFYGPAYLLIAQPAAQGIRLVFSATTFESWHLVNFLTFQVGLLFFYLLLLRWINPMHAVVASAFLGWQPLYWGHAFNNPKDIPFLVFCLITIYFGYKFVDQNPQAPKKLNWVALVFFGIFLGLTTSIRVIGPVAGLVVFLNLLFQKQFHKLPAFFLASAIALLVMTSTWPYLWSDPINNLVAVLKHMSNNPTELAVLFNGEIFRANQMPSSYIPKMLAITLTEPTWLLVTIGLVALFRGMAKQEVEWQSLLPFSILFLLLMAYILLLKPAVYDGFRHFFFITPILFILVGLAIKAIRYRLSPRTASLFYLVILLPGVFGIFQTHPYQYSYYNQFVGGTSGAFRKYETDYWLTCYQPALEWFDQQYPGQTLAVQREIQLAKAYAFDIPITEPGPTVEGMSSGSFLLSHSRANLDQRSVFRKVPVLKTFGTDEAQFCMIKQVE